MRSKHIIQQYIYIVIYAYQDNFLVGGNVYGFPVLQVLFDIRGRIAYQNIGRHSLKIYYVIHVYITDKATSSHLNKYCR